jgi:hypothetical protein
MALRFGNDKVIAESGGEAVKYEVIRIRKLNASGHTCTFEEHYIGPSIVPDRAEGEEPFIVNQIPLPPRILNPGQAVQQTWKWRANAPAAGRHCFQPQWISGPVLVVAPSLLRPVCSNIDVSQWSRVEMPGPVAETASLLDDAQTQAFRLTAEKNTYDAGEWFPLQLALDPAGADDPPDAECPTLYLRERSPDGGTRIDEVKPRDFKACGTHPFGRDANGSWSQGFELDSGAMSRWMGVGEHSLQVLKLAGSADDPELRFSVSNILRIKIIDPATLPRRWGPLTKGLRIDVTLDKDTYRVDEEIPLHIAIEAMNPDVPVLSWDVVWDPCIAVSVKVLDDRGNEVPLAERFNHTGVCFGHGFGPRPFKAATIVPVEMRLRDMGWLPKRPGNYTIVASWSANVGAKVDPKKMIQSPDPQTCVLTSASATLHIVADSAAH